MSRSIFVRLSASLVLIILLSCQNNSIPPSVNSMIFGHLGGFCNKCDVLYKIENGVLYTTGHQQQIDPSNVQFSPLPTAQYDSVKDLVTKLPTAIFDEMSLSIGTPFPDVGYTYLAIRKSDVSRHWNVQANDVPGYLQPFLGDVSKVLDALW